jgi:hypothetical protein
MCDAQMDSVFQLELNLILFYSHDVYTKMIRKLVVGFSFTFPKSLYEVIGKRIKIWEKANIHLKR